MINVHGILIFFIICCYLFKYPYYICIYAFTFLVIFIVIYVSLSASYAPTETSSEQGKEQFYSELNDSVANISQHNLVVIAGGFNARIGSTSNETPPSVIGSYTYHDQKNTNGQYLVDFCEEQNLISAFHCQPHKKNICGHGNIQT